MGRSSSLIVSCLLLAGGASVASQDAARPCESSPSPSPSLSLWLDTFASIARRADMGDTDAARLALAMQRHGPRVYGVRFEASPAQLRRWSERLAAAGPTDTSPG